MENNDIQVVEPYSAGRAFYTEESWWKHGIAVSD